MYINRCEGEPSIVATEKEYEGRDAEGNIEYSINYIYNCHECDNSDCQYWSEYNG